MSNILEIQMKFGDRLKQVREAMQWTQKDLAKVANINAMQISHFESNRRLPTITNAIKLCRALSVSMDWLCRGIRSNYE